MQCLNRSSNGRIVVAVKLPINNIRLPIFDSVCSRRLAVSRAQKKKIAHSWGFRGKSADTYEVPNGYSTWIGTFVRLAIMNESAVAPAIPETPGYWRQTRQPMYSALLVLPFILVYEIGIFFMHSKFVNGGDAI